MQIDRSASRTSSSSLEVKIPAPTHDTHVGRARRASSIANPSRVVTAPISATLVRPRNTHDTAGASIDDHRATRKPSGARSLLDNPPSLRPPFLPPRPSVHLLPSFLPVCEASHHHRSWRRRRPFCDVLQDKGSVALRSVGPHLRSLAPTSITNRTSFALVAILVGWLAGVREVLDAFFDDDDGAIYERELRSRTVAAFLYSCSPPRPNQSLG